MLWANGAPSSIRFSSELGDFLRHDFVEKFAGFRHEYWARVSTERAVQSFGSIVLGSIVEANHS